MTTCCIFYKMKWNIPERTIDIIIIWYFVVATIAILIKKIYLAFLPPMRVRNITVNDMNDLNFKDITLHPLYFSWPYLPYWIPETTVITIFFFWPLKSTFITKNRNEKNDYKEWNVHYPFTAKNIFNFFIYPYLTQIATNRPCFLIAK